MKTYMSLGTSDESQPSSPQTLRNPFLRASAARGKFESRSFLRTHSPEDSLSYYSTFPRDETQEPPSQPLHPLVPKEDREGERKH